MTDKITPEEELADWNKSDVCLKAKGQLNFMLNSIEREGIEKIREYLMDSDYLTAPASGKFHGNKPGGLLLHSLTVTRVFEMINLTQDLGLSNESVFICGILHDICKCNLRSRVTNKDGSISKQSGGWAINHDNHYGHGDKSIYMITSIAGPNFLTEKEFAIIRWHMYAFDKNFWDYQTYIGSHPEIRIFHGCDQIATGIEEMGK